MSMWGWMDLFATKRALPSYSILIVASGLGLTAVLLA